MKKSFYYSLFFLCLFMFASCGGGKSESGSVDKADSEGIKEHEWVDLGLPSGTLWATENVGASSPEDYREYFAWGETQANSIIYSFATYKWCEGNYNNLTKYCTDSGFGNVDNKTELDMEDDAAYVNWGSEWRMPTKTQFDELQAECNWQWTSMNGINGYLVTSKRNSASLFLPAAGYREGSSLYDAGSCGFYLSRTLDTDLQDSAYYLYFDSGHVKENLCIRSLGLSVRAVRVP